MMNSTTLAGSPKLLNLGCGTRYHPSWINVDIYQCGPGVIPCHLGRDLPFRDFAFDAVYSSHVLEHFSRRSALAFLKECHRVLKPKGILRVVVPDLEQIALIYLDLLHKSLDGDPEARNRYEWIMIEMLDQMVRTEPGGDMLRYWIQDPMPAKDFVIERVGSELNEALRSLHAPENKDLRDRLQSDSLSRQPVDPLMLGKFRLSGEVHQWMYDRYSLGALLEKVGFSRIRVCHADESNVPLFKSYFLDMEPDGKVRKPDSLFMEALKS